MTTRAMAFPTNKFQPKTVWEHYCKYTLGIHPSQATEDHYTSLIAGQEMTNILISMTTTRTNTQNIITN
jgi:hypothetical protein